MVETEFGGIINYIRRMNQTKQYPNENISIKYYFLLILIFAVIILNIFISKTHGISPDSLDYFEMSENFI